MTPFEMAQDIRRNFPDITAKADDEHINVHDDSTLSLEYLWFESLANVLNHEMNDGISPRLHESLFEYFRTLYASGSKDIQDCIDASFIENLFWKVPPDKARPYWHMFPATLKELYVRFHGHEPA